MKDDIQRTLKSFGLSENEIAVYLEALKLDETSPYELSKKTGIARTTVYDVITDLSLKNLLELEKSDGFTKQQTKIRAKNPSTLRKLVREKHDDLYKLEVDLVNILPSLKDDYHNEKPTSSACDFYPGIDGAKKVYLMENKIRGIAPISVFTNLLPMDAFGKKFVNSDVTEITQKLLASGQSIRELIPLNDWTKHILTYQVGREPEYLIAREYRYIDSTIFEQYQRMSIAGDRVMITSTHETEAHGISIRSEAMAKSMLSIFETLWVSATPIDNEKVRSWGENKFAKFE